MKLSLRIPTATLALLAVITLPVPLLAEQHHHYKLVDLGTLGGPTAYKSVNAPSYQILKTRGWSRLVRALPWLIPTRQMPASTGIVMSAMPHAGEMESAPILAR